MGARPAGSGSGCVDPAPSVGSEAVAAVAWGPTSRLGVWGRYCCCCSVGGCSGSSSTCCATMLSRSARV